MKKIKKWIGSLPCVVKAREDKIFHLRYFPRKETLGACGENTFIEYPVYFDSPENVYLEEDVKVRSIARFVNSPNERITIKKYTVVGPDCMIISNNHRKTVGVPQFLLGTSHINDRAVDTTVGEDVWIGARVTIMPGANIGRGCIIGACALVTHPVPPYSVVIGSPARIIGKVYGKEDILRHEEALYVPAMRMTREQIDQLFADHHYDQLKTYGNNQPLTEAQLRQLEGMKKEWRFVGKEERK